MKKIISTIIILAMTLVLIPLSASALVVGDWEVEISNGEAAIIGYTGICPDKMTLPTTIGNFSVTGLKTNIFTDNVTEIIIPEGYTNISIPNSYGKNLSNLKDTLTKITLPSTLVEFNVSFDGFSKLTEINIPCSVKVIPSGQFKDCINLKKVVLNDGLEKIGDSAFFGCCNLPEIKIPNTVKEIKGWAFRGCHSLKDIVIPNSVEILGDEKSTAAIIFCDNLETVVLSDNIKKLCSGRGSWGELANCPKLKSVYIGTSVNELQNSPGAYEGILGGCNSIETVIIPENVTIIGSCSFKNDNNLKTVVLPKSFSKIQFNLVDSIPFYQYLRDSKQPLPMLYLYGYKGTFAEKFAAANGFPFVDISVATPTNSKVKIDGTEVAFTAYNIGGNNYFKLRDVASAISGTSKNFNVGWDGNNNAISLISKTAYSNVGGELQINLNAVAVEPIITNPKIFVDGKLTTFMAFGINGNNYIKLRDLGEVFDFSVEWNDSTQTIEISTKKGYSK